MKGFVPTPDHIVDTMVDSLFAKVAPSPDSTLLDPGCGPGAFIDGVLRWCSRRGLLPPRIVGIDLNPGHADFARARFSRYPNVEIRHADFLKGDGRAYDYVVGNPPYVSINDLSGSERAEYRSRYATATNRFDLYGLFFEQALRQLKPDGCLVFITPEKFLYVESAIALRVALTEWHVAELRFLPEDTFDGFVTYPLVTTIRGRRTSSRTTVSTRDGQSRNVRLPQDGRSWLGAIAGVNPHVGATLEEVSLRISCGVATGADAQFVVPDTDLDRALRPFSYPTIAGKQLQPGQVPIITDRILVPYNRTGRLIPEENLGALGTYLCVRERRTALERRTCVQRKPWYAFHESPPLSEMLRPKILCKDISKTPHFFLDRTGEILPRHSVYYIVPRNPAFLEQLGDYLNSSACRAWLLNHCQRAAGGFIRLQSHVLKQLPVPSELASNAIPSSRAAAVAAAKATIPEALTVDLR